MSKVKDMVIGGVIGSTLTVGTGLSVLGAVELRNRFALSEAIRPTYQKVSYNEEYEAPQIEQLERLDTNVKSANKTAMKGKVK
jgi:hypothetical protein